MHILKAFLAGAFLGAGAFGALTHAAWISTTRMMSIVPALTVADIIETGGALAAGLIALIVVARRGSPTLVQSALRPWRPTTGPI